MAEWFLAFRQRSRFVSMKAFILTFMTTPGFNIGAAALARFSSHEVSLVEYPMKRSCLSSALVLCLFVTFVSWLDARKAEPGRFDQHPDSRDGKQAEKFDGPSELPRVRIATSMRDTPAPGKVIRVKSGEDASAAIEKASCGDTIELQAGATFNWLVLPAKQCDDSHWIINCFGSRCPGQVANDLPISVAPRIPPRK